MRRAPGQGPAGPQVPQGPRIIGSVRRSHVASTFGPGSVVDFRAPGSGAPLSGLVTGLEEWDGAAPNGRSGLLHFQRTYEPRLQRLLRVGGFRLPPVKEAADESWTDVLPVVRFPHWLMCPACERLAPADEFSFDPNRPERRCAGCSRDASTTYAVPVRFIVACENGHLDEFPWTRWIDCKCASPRLVLKTTGAGLAGKLVQCTNTDCAGSPRSLEGAFGSEVLATRRMACAGKRPWLPTAPEWGCEKKPRVIQRGASSVYYSAIESALDIPPFSPNLSQVIGPYADDVMSCLPKDWPDFIRINRLEEKSGTSREELLRTFEEWRQWSEGKEADAPLEWAEYRQLKLSAQEPVDKGEFQTRPEPVPQELKPYLDSVVLARRLREVRALVGFTRIKPASGPFRSDNNSRLARISVQPPKWLPAVELRGEGIFMRFSEKALEAWEGKNVRARANWLASRRTNPHAEPAEESLRTGPRFLLLHSFAHALMRQLSLSCGYSSAALRERLYVGDDPYAMCGVLIHTGSADSEGTLGGLVRQGKQEFLEKTIREMLASMAWCSSDPLCITCAVTLSSPDNLSACHACLLVPETSCQHFNLLLDRAMLVGTPEDPSVGYFNPLLARNS
ncbi:DUF1998 domain-containing protein [Corallococcus sp. AB045]|uniref:DUF1998 domain-containing protein n=1 Tax=Corallococcus sp. AB045 TaxID=2316719 RepID=UPI000EC49785|nr:DUF1998 domain-containing protein [Corallococcus sp. AB045]RKH89435.1 DUF1998 domain-containing protein [Corallococcus sp. AB045]